MSRILSPYRNPYFDFMRAILDNACKELNEVPLHEVVWPDDDPSAQMRAVEVQTAMYTAHADLMKAANDRRERIRSTHRRG